MKSKVTLYYKSLVNKEKNFVLDNQDGTSALETYLSTLQSEFINEYQYVKQGLSVSIKLNKNQTALEMVDSKDLNYIKIQNYNDEAEPQVLEKPYYYFVIAKNWRAKDTIELVLSMDTLNTFRFNYDYRLNAKSIIKRMHKDRFDSKIYETQIDCEDIECTGSRYGFNTRDEVVAGEDLTDEDITALNLGQYTIEPVQIYDATLEQNIPLSLINYIEYGLRWDERGLIRTLYCWIDAYLNIPQGNLDGHTIYFAFVVNINNKYIYKKIDFKSEDISAPVYKKEEHTLYEQEGGFRNSWVLYYKNKDNQEDSPVECYLTADRNVKFLTETGSNTINVNNIPLGKILVISPYFQGEVVVDVDGEKFYVKSYLNQWRMSCIGFENANEVLVVHIYSVSEPEIGPAVNQVTETNLIVNPSQVAIDTSIEELKGREVDNVASSYGFTDPNNPFYRSNTTIPLASLITRQIADSSTIDKTLSENLKIINIPYCPSQITEEDGKYVIEPLWRYEAVLKFFKLIDFTPVFQNSITTDVDSILNIFTSGIITPDLTMNRTIIDSKLYHSDYYRPKFVYDSFSRIFPLEQIDYVKSYESINSDKFKFTFVMSRNIVSKFLFKFDFVYKHSNEDYPNVVAVARNNEEVLYNSAYLNYVRTGYNYDLKAKERSETASGVGLGLNIAGLIASIGLSFIPGGQALGVAGVVGSTLGLAGQIVNYAKTISQNEENLQRRLQETQRQAVSVLNADDYDLLQAYTDNKAKLCLYEVSEQMKRVLDDLFYYCGYVVNEQMIPNISSRYWFNFVQAGLIIEDSSNLNSDIEDDIKEKFEQGVTFLHYHNEFDFNQEKENWETSLLD